MYVGMYMGYGLYLEWTHGRVDWSPHIVKMMLNGGKDDVAQGGA